MVRNVGNVGSCKFMTLLQEEMRQGEVAAGGTVREAAWGPHRAQYYLWLQS